MACSSCNKLELGEPTFERKHGICERPSDKTNRAVARMRPFIAACGKEIIGNTGRMAGSDVQAVTTEDMKLSKTLGSSGGAAT